MRIISILTLLTAGSICASAASKLPGTPFTTNNTLNGRVVENICDGNTDTYFYAQPASYAWAALDLGAEHVVTSIQFATPNASKTFLGMFQGANKEDFSDAVPLAMVTVTPLEGRMNELTVKCSRGVRYVRYVGPSDSHSQISEIEVYGEPGKGDDSALWQVTNLPTVVVNTVNSEEPYDKEHDIAGSIIIISEGGADILDAPGTIRERGNASRSFPKKPWRIKFDKKQQPLDAPAKAKKWTLINNYGDKTLMRNILAFETAKMMGMDYVPYCRPVDVVLNGEYKGCYQLCDQVEVNKNRVDIDEMEPTDNEGEALTGGYLVEVDAYAYEEESWFETAHYGLPVTIKSPDEDEITPEQKAYIKKTFDTLEPEMKSRDGYDCTDPVNGYRRLFDTRSFIQHMLVNEVAGNTDTYWSTYMTKRRGDDKIYTGPVWDFDLGFNNDARSYPVTQRSGNNYLWDTDMASAANGMRYFAQRILQKDPTTAKEIHDVWAAARKAGFSAEWLEDRVEYWADELDASQKLNFKRWPILNQAVHQNPHALGSYEKEVEKVRDYMKPQIDHLDKMTGFDPSTLDDPSAAEIIEEPAADTTTFYDLLGRRVENPGAGLYIRGDGKKIFIK